MRLAIHAIGRMKAGPETELLNRYMERGRKSGRALGLDGPHLREWPESRHRDSASRMAEEAERMLEAMDPGARLICLDERGDQPTSQQFAKLLRRWQEEGTGETVVAIGGADGLAPLMRERGSRIISFGAMTLPHQLVRILAAEQIYRAITILSGHPYHRD